MFQKVIGFLTLKGWKGVNDIYIFVIIGTIIGIGSLYYFLVYQKEHKPKRLTPIQSYIVKIISLVALLVFILIVT